MEVYGVSKALGWSRFVLMGHSMGAGVASLFAGAFPSLVEKLILVDGISPWLRLKTAPELLSSAIEERVRTVKRSRNTYASLDHAVKRYCERAQIREENARHIVRCGTRIVEMVEDKSANDGRGNRGIVVEPGLNGGDDGHAGDGDGDDDQATATTISTARTSPVTKTVGKPAVTAGGNVRYQFSHDTRLHFSPLVQFTETQAEQFMTAITCPVLFFMARNPNSIRWKKMFIRRAALVNDVRWVEIDGSHHLHLDEADSMEPIVLRFLGLSGSSPTSFNDNSKVTERPIVSRSSKL